jgi:maltose O-acetyltransferase
MPLLKILPENIETFVYNAKSNPRPQADGFLRLVQKIEKLPIPYIVIRRLLNRGLHFPDTISYIPGFKFIVGQLFCGENVGLGDTEFIDYAPIYIGNNVGFSFRNIVITSTHDFTDFNNVIAKSIIIEDNVWITTNVTILPGVRIGKNSVIGAGSVVVNDIPPNVLAVGNPCKPIKNINREIKNG